MHKLKQITSKLCTVLLVCTSINGYCISGVFADSSSNLVSNGNFENTSDDTWKNSDKDGTGTITLDDKVFHGGSGHSKKIEGTNTSAAVGNVALVSPGKEYFLDAWIKGNNITTKNSDYGGEVIAVQQIDKDGNVIDGEMSLCAKAGTFDWKETGISFIANEKAYSVVVMLQLQGSGTAWFDDISLTENSSNSGLFPNGGFEKSPDDSFYTYQGSGTPNMSIDSKVFHGTSGHSEKISGNSVECALCKELILKPGKDYSFTAWVKGENVVSANTQNGSGQGIVITQLDKDGNDIANTEKEFDKTGTYDWQQVKMNFTVNQNASSILISFGLIGSGTVWFDDFSLIESNASVQLNSNIKRLSGTDRIETSLNIAKEEFSDKAPDAVILTTANNFPDALSGANLAYKCNAPILLVNQTVNDSKSTLNYVTSILPKGKEVYLLGGTGAVSSEIENYIKDKGYTVIRLQGKSRYETNQSIFDKLSVAKGTPVIICTGESFADALSVSSIAAAKGYPILLNSKDALLSNVKDDLAKIQPSIVYIIGGTGVISDKVNNEIAQITNKAPVRIGGSDRYDTSMKIIEAFNLTSDTITVATGENFPDALSGSLFAAKKSSAILLINNNVSSSQKNLVKNHNIKSVYIFGGEGVLKNSAANELLQ